MCSDAHSITLISNVIDSCSQLNIHSSQIKWEICKIEIKSKSIDYAKFKSRERNNTLQQLEKELSNFIFNPTK